MQSTDKTFSEVIEYAIIAATNKKKVGLLISTNSDFDWENQDNYKDGDPETVYSIASLYTSAYGLNREETSELENRLIEIFGE